MPLSIEKLRLEIELENISMYPSPPQHDSFTKLIESM